MDRILTPGGRWSRLLIVLIGLHSCVLGLGMLFFPGPMMRFSGFPPMPVFFPSQAGLFLIILGVCYLWSLADVAFVKIILLSKAKAVVFLVFHAVFLSVPPMVIAAAFGDAAMLLGLGAVLYWESRAGETRPLAEGG